MKSISFNEQYGDWNARIRALVLGMLALFMIVVYSVTFIIADSGWLAVESERAEEISQGGVLGAVDKQANLSMTFDDIAEDIVSFSINAGDTTSPLFADLVFYSPDVEIFDAYCIDVVRCTAELEGDYLYIGIQGVIPPVSSLFELVHIEFNAEESGNLILDNGLYSSSYIMEQGSDVNLIGDAYFSFHIGAN